MDFSTCGPGIPGSHFFSPPGRRFYHNFPCMNVGLAMGEAMVTLLKK
jgi:hypothetical protein